MGLGLVIDRAEAGWGREAEGARDQEPQPYKALQRWQRLELTAAGVIMTLKLITTSACHLLSRD